MITIIAPKVGVTTMHQLTNMGYKSKPIEFNKDGIPFKFRCTKKTKKGK